MPNLVSKLPALADDALKVLQGNAERLARSGTTAQQTAALALIPAIAAEVEVRRAAKVSQAAALAAKAPKRRAKVKDNQTKA